MNDAVNERVLLIDWYKSSHPAYQDNTLIAKVSSVTKRGLWKLRHDIEDLVQNRDSPSSDTGLTINHISHVTLSGDATLSLFHEMNKNEVTYSTM